MSKKQINKVFARASAWLKQKPASFKHAEVMAMAKQIIDMRNAIRAHIEMEEWRDIVTAPHDRVIELAGPENMDGKFLYFPHAEWGKTIFGWKGWFNAMNGRRLNYSSEYTHWRPLRSRIPPKVKVCVKQK